MSQFKTSDGIELYVEEIGSLELPLIIWSHGFTGSARNWRSTCRKLPNFRHVIYDMRGHARSDDPASSEVYVLDRLGQDVVELAQKFGRGGMVFLAGLSLGAMVSFAAVALAPKQFQACVLSALPDATHEKSISQTATEFSRAIRDKGLEAAGAEYVWGATSGLSERDASLVKQGFMEHPAHSLASLLEVALGDLPSSPEFAASLVESQLPVLLLFGDRDIPAVAFSRRVFEEINTQMPVEITEISGGGHLLNLTSGQAFCDEIDRFFGETLS